MRDPAALFYIDTWLSSTAEMDSDVRGWYLNLILHQYDKKDLPNDIEKLAVLAGVKFSEFKRFEQMFEQVLKQKFKQNDNGRLENSYAKTVLQKREVFKDKREKSGNIGVVIKLAKTIKGFTDKHLTTLKDTLYNLSIDEIEKHKDKQMLEQMLKLYINGDENENKDLIKDENKKELFEIFRVKYLGTKKGLDTEFSNFTKKHNDWEQCLDLILPALEKQIETRSIKKAKGLFVPEWKNLQTWINQRCWEEETQIIETKNSDSNKRQVDGLSQEEINKMLNDGK